LSVWLVSCGIFVLKVVGLSGETTIKIINRTSKTSIKGVTFIFGLLFIRDSPFKKDLPD
jgi:hypothetical protein